VCKKIRTAQKVIVWVCNKLPVITKSNIHAAISFVNMAQNDVFSRLNNLEIFILLA